MVQDYSIPFIILGHKATTLPLAMFQKFEIIGAEEHFVITKLWRRLCLAKKSISLSRSGVFTLLTHIMI